MEITLGVGAEKLSDSVKATNYCILAIQINSEDSLKVNPTNIFIIDNKNKKFTHTHLHMI